MTTIDPSTLPPLEQSRLFLNALHPDPQGSKITIWTIDLGGKTVPFWCETPQEAADVAQRESIGRNIYVGVGLSPRGPGDKYLQNEISCLGGLWADVDVIGPTHDKGAASIEDAAAVIKRFGMCGLPATGTIGSGTGLQSWWLFKEPWFFENDADRRRALVLIARFANKLESIAKGGYNFSVKGTFNLNRLMRVPGTFNLCKGKCDAQSVRIIELDDARRYDPSDFEQILDATGDAGVDSEEPIQLGDLTFSASAEPPADKFNQLTEDNPLFLLSWQHERADEPNWSCSEYDQSITTFAANAGWTEQEVCNLMIAHRRMHKADLKLGLPCYTLTLGRAFAKAKRREQQKAEAIEKARVGVDKAIDKAIAEGNASVAFDAAADLAALPAGEQADAIAALKESLGEKLNKPQLKQAVKSAGKAARKARQRTDLPQIVINGRQLPEVTADAVAAMAKKNNPPVVFTRGMTATRLRVDDDGRLTLSQMNEAAMMGRIARVANFFLASADGELNAATPSERMIRDVLSLDLADYARTNKLTPFPPIDAVTEIPVLRPDWSILDTPGYDTATRLFYAPAPGFELPPVPSCPTQEDRERALEILNEAIGEFPYEADADKANAFATMLTPIVRHVAGKAPLALADAPQAGTGKTLLADVITFIATGSQAAMMGAPADDNEWRKQITSVLLNGPTIIIIDNLDGTLSSANLARALTSDVWSDRVLGASQQVNLRQVATWIATGNNITLGGDMPRRCYRVRLDAKTARPWKDRPFKHPNLMEWVSANRGQLVWALLVLCRAWHSAGRPASPKTPVLGMFESWCRTVGGILLHTGMGTFLHNLEGLYDQADEEAADWERFLTAVHDQYAGQPISVGKMLEDMLGNAENLRNALPEGLAGFVASVPSQYGPKFHIPDAGKFKIRLGKQLKLRTGRRYGEQGRHLVRTEDSHTRTAVWAVESAGSAGSCGSVSTPSGVETVFSSACEEKEKNNMHTSRAGNTPATTRTPRNGHSVHIGDFDPNADLEERAAMADTRTN